MNKRDILLQNITEYSKQAAFAKSSSAFNSCVTLYFKAIAAVSDLVIFDREGRIPSSHSERFRILQEKFKDIYKMIDKDFPIYQDSYRLKMKKEHADVLENDFKKIKNIAGIVQ